jgi:hypothetical protein
LQKSAIKIVFPERYDADNTRGLNLPLGEGKNRTFDINEISNWFEDFEVKNIELWIEASIRTGDVIKLFVSAEGKGGIKVTLAPRQKNH